MEVSAPQIPTPKPRRGTLAVGPFPPGLRLRGYHPLRRDFPDHFGFAGEGAADPQQPHIPDGFPHRVQFGLSPFRSPLLRGSQLVSFPPPTWMLPFGGFPLPHPPRSSEELPRGLWERPRRAWAGGPIRASPDLRLHAPTRGLSQLATPFVGSRAEPSTGRRPLSGRTGSRLGWPMHGLIVSVKRSSLSPSPPTAWIGGCTDWLRAQRAAIPA